MIGLYIVLFLYLYVRVMILSDIIQHHILFNVSNRLIMALSKNMVSWLQFSKYV